MRTLLLIAATSLALATGGVTLYAAAPKTAAHVHADDLETVQAGGPGGSLFRASDGFSVPMSNLARARRTSFLVGKSLFEENWVATPASVKTRQGLGPIFNAQSCSTCHMKDGRGKPPDSHTEPMVSMLVRLSVPGEGPHGAPKPEPVYGNQFQHRANPGIRSKGDVTVRFREIEGAYPDGTKYTLLAPQYEFKNLAFGPMAETLLTSGRVAPQTYGMGLLEAIPEASILKLPAVMGSKGRPNWVWDESAKKKRLGRFGWKANQPSVIQQSAGAFLGDMGITSPLFPAENCARGAEDCARAPKLPHPDISASDLGHVEAYMRLVAVPARRGLKDPAVREGAALFERAQCQTCHVPSHVTGKVPGIPELSQVRIFPYTDLLLHDMGPGLADGRPDFLATGSEWRTPPLWGLGEIPKVNGHSRLLHDGRARSFEEAILWHGGEAEDAKESFRRMTADERRKLVRFLEAI